MQDAEKRDSNGALGQRALPLEQPPRAAPLQLKLATSTAATWQSAIRHRRLVAHSPFQIPHSKFLASPAELGNDILDHVAVDVGEAVVPALEAMGEFLVVEAQEVHPGGLEVVDVHRVFGDVEA